MEPISDSVAQEGPRSFNRHLNGGNPVSAVFGFPVSENQFKVLQTAGSQSQTQREEGLVDPKSTRLSRLAAWRAED